MSCQGLRAAGLMFAFCLLPVTNLLHASGPSQARVVTRAAPPAAAWDVRDVAVDEGRQHIRVIERQVVAPAAVVSRSLAEQPVYLHLVEVRVVNTMIYIDPDRDYVRKGGLGGLDEGHFIVRAQRLHHARRAMPARVVRNELAGLVPMSPTPGGPGVLFIIPKPEFPSQPLPGDRVRQETVPDVGPAEQRPQRVTPTAPASPNRATPPPARIVRAD